MSKEKLFQQVDGKLLFDGIDLENDIASQYGTPTYLFSSRKIRENINHLSTVFKKYYPETEITSFFFILTQYILGKRRVDVVLEYDNTILNYVKYYTCFT